MPESPDPRRRRVGPCPEAGLHVLSGTPDMLLIAENGSSYTFTARDIRRSSPIDPRRLDASLIRLPLQPHNAN